MKAQHRHELETNQLAEWLDAKIEQLKPYTQAIVGVLVAVVVLLGVYLYLKHADSAAEQAASDQLVAAINNRIDPLKALQEMVESHPNTQQAVVARLLMGQELLRLGSEQLYSNKPEGKKNLASAANEFSEVDLTSKDQMLRAWALYGLGRAHESLGELDRAQSDYEKLKKEFPGSFLAGAAQRHLANLKQQSTKEFYDWFAKQDPRPLPMEREPGSPGQKPIFDLSDPTAMPNSEVKLPSALEGPLSPATPPANDIPPMGTDVPAAPSGESPPPATPSPTDASNAGNASSGETTPQVPAGQRK